MPSHDPSQSQPNKDDRLRDKQPQPGKGKEGPMGDQALTEESAKDPDIDRSKTPGRDYDV